MRTDRAIGIPNYDDDYSTPASRQARRRLEKRPTLLWVDDSPDLLDLYQTVFQSLGFDVLTTSSAQEAVNYLGLADVVILDYDMPVLNGTALASLLKSIDASKAIIMHSGNTSIPPVARQWVDAICPKGAPREELLAAIGRLSAGRPVGDQEILPGAICQASPDRQVSRDQREMQLEFLQLPSPDFPGRTND